MEDSTKRNPSVANQVSISSGSSDVSDGIGEVNIVITEIQSQNSVTSQNCRPGKRRIEKVPLLLRKDKENKRCYYPQVVSLGPYHHGKAKLKLVEDFKPTVLEMFVSDSDKHTDDFYKKVFEVIDEARSGYVAGSTDSYKDEAFAKMMLLDGCFILYLIDCYIGVTPWKMLRDHLGALTTGILLVDLLLLENQLPFIVLLVLMRLKLGEKRIDTFIEILFSGSLRNQNNQQTEVNQEEKRQPLHLLEAYWTRTLSGEVNKPLPQTLRYMCNRWRKKSPVKRCITECSPTFRSVTELKAKGICVGPSRTRNLHDVKFKSNWFYGQLELPTIFASWDAKIWLLNTVAYEMGPNNPSTYDVTSYFFFMKLLIDHPEDGKDLRSKHVLFNTRASDKEVVKMFKEINIYGAEDMDVYVEVRDSIQKHYNSKARTWMAELYFKYFSSPWNAIALLGAFILLALSVFQTYYAGKDLQSK